MLICNCTLLYTNPEACKGCCSYLKEYTGMAYDWNTSWWEFTRPQTIVLKPDEYDRNRYELVEKKNWKLNQLKGKLKEKQDAVELRSKMIDGQISRLEEYKKDIDQLEQEIKDLEQ